jgi:hypothetical protein
VVMISDAEGIARLGVRCAFGIMVPQCAPFVAPLLYTIPVQLLAYHTAVLKGTDVVGPPMVCSTRPCRIPKRSVFFWIGGPGVGSLGARRFPAKAVDGSLQIGNGGGLPSQAQTLRTLKDGVLSERITGTISPTGTIRQ